MSQIKLDERTKGILAQWVRRAMDAERERLHCRETVASILQIVAPGVEPDRIHLDAHTMQVTILEPTDSRDE